MTKPEEVPVESSDLVSGVEVVEEIPSQVSPGRVLEMATEVESDEVGVIELEWGGFWTIGEGVCFSVSSPTGKRHVFKAYCAEDRQKAGSLILFIRFDSGGLDERYPGSSPKRKFDFLGLLHPQGPHIHLSGRSSACNANDEVYKVASWAMAVLYERDTIPVGYEIIPASEYPDRLVAS